MTPTHDTNFSGINYNIEFLRIIGASGIICYHSSFPSCRPGYAGLIVFILLSVYLLVSVQRKNIISLISRRAGRMIVPWFVFFIFYGFLNLINSKPFFPQPGIFCSILAGSQIHLWYLPFIFLMGIPLFYVNRLVWKYKKHALLILSMLRADQHAPMAAAESADRLTLAGMVSCSTDPSYRNLLCSIRSLT